MTAGIQVKNDFGNFQIDETYRNLVVVQAGRIGGNIDFTLGADGLIAFRPDIGALVQIVAVQRGVATKTVSVVAGGGVQVYIFDYGAPRGSSNGGLEVYLPGGVQIAYSSFYDYLKVVDTWGDSDPFYPYRPGAIESGGMSVYPDAGRVLALAPTNMSRGTNIQPTGDGFSVDEYMLGFNVERNVDGVGVRQYEQLRAAGVADSGAGFRPPWFGGVWIDVTGFPGNV